MSRTIFVIILLAIFFPKISHADVCDSLRTENTKLNLQAVGILADHPILTTVFAGCAVGALDEYEKTNNGGSATGVFLGCTGLACLFSPDGSCKDTAKRWFSVILKKSNVKDDAKKYGCAL